MTREVFLLDITDFRPLDSSKPKKFLDWITRALRTSEASDTAPEENDSSALQAGSSSGGQSGIQLIGAWYAVGITGHEQFRAFSLYHCRGGWRGGWLDMMKLYEGVPDSMFLSSIDNLRHTARSVPLVAAPGSPTIADLAEPGPAGAFAMIEFAEAAPGMQLEYLAAVRVSRAPILQDHGYRLAGLYEVAFSNTRTAVLWTLDLDSQVSYLEARDAARGLGEGPVDERIARWEHEVTTFCSGEVQELYLAGYPGPLLSPHAEA
ncbi:hypothetical protein [Rhodococcus sp. 077-4]|uniref:hypothetical protein n=1 Tax=Rhodococcus sp. 077-4 TaxID=2789271 RepID=UPI0039F5283C